MNPFALSGLLAGVFSTFLAFLVWHKCENKSLGRTWLFFALSVAGWGFGSMAIALSTDPVRSLWVFRVADIFGIIVIPACLCHFVCVFCGIKRPVAVTIHYVVAFVALLLSFNPLFISGVRWVFNSFYYAIPGRLYAWFSAWWFLSIIYCHVELIRHYKVCPPDKKNKIKYFLLATMIGFSGGSLCYLPSFHIDVYPWGNFTIFLYTCIMSYAILKHHLMDISLVIQKTVLSACFLLTGIILYIVCVAHFTHRGVLPLSNFSILISILSTTMALAVILKGPLRKINVMWALTCLSIATWSLGFAMLIRSGSVSQADFWTIWFVYPGSVCIPILFLNFVGLLLKRRIGYQLIAGYAFAAIFMCLALNGKMSEQVARPTVKYYTQAHFPFYHFYVLYFSIIAFYAHWLLFREMKRTVGAIKNQIVYVFLGTSVGFSGGATAFLLSFNIQFFPLGVYLVPLYLFTVTYAIYKHHLMDINLVFRKSVVYSVMTAILTAIYLVALTEGSRVLQSFFGASNITTSIVAACFITAIFLPLRDRVQGFVDRFFFRDWADQPMAREIAAGFSHELKSPLASLSMQAQMALAELQEVEDGGKAWLTALPKIKQDLQGLLNKTMEAARRIEAVRGVAEPSRGQIEPVDIPSVLDSSLSALQPLVNEVEAVIRRDIPGNLPPAQSNLKQLEIVFINLMKNALESMEGSRNDPHVLALAGSEQNGSVLISVKDTGAGIPSKDLGHIFDPHFTTKGRKGTGMGLFLAQQIIKTHGGSIEVKSEEGKGTEFIVRLPKYSVQRAA